MCYPRVLTRTRISDTTISAGTKNVGFTRPCARAIHISLH